MKQPPERWGLTAGEKRALLLLAAALLIGSGYRWIQHREAPAEQALTAQDSAAVQRIRQAYFARSGGEDEDAHHPASSPAASDGMTVNGRLDLNRADQAALEELPGIGPVLAERILDLRRREGHFETVDDLLKVRGIGEKKLQAISSRVFCGKADSPKTPADATAEDESEQITGD